MSGKPIKAWNARDAELLGIPVDTRSNWRAFLDTLREWAETKMGLREDPRAKERRVQQINDEIARRSRTFAERRQRDDAADLVLD